MLDRDTNTTILVRSKNNVISIYPYAANIKFFHDNGFIESEGLGLFGEESDFLVDGIMRYGHWTYYDTSGILVRKEFYKEGQHDAECACQRDD